MSANRVILFLLAFVCFSFIQKKKDNRIDKYMALVDKNLKAKKLSSQKSKNHSKLKCTVTGYYSNQKLVLIKTFFTFSVGFKTNYFYILNDSLVCVKEIAQTEVENPEFFNACITNRYSHTDKNGDVELSGTLKQNDRNLYYMSDTVIIDFKLKSFGKPKQAFEDEIAEKNKEIIEHYRVHLKELME